MQDNTIEAVRVIQPTSGLAEHTDAVMLYLHAFDCLDDAKLVYDLWVHGNDEGFIKSRSRETGEVMEYEVKWE